MILNRIIKAPEQSFFLLGPRGSGKSTWLRATFPGAHVIDFLSEETYQRLLANPGYFADELCAVAQRKGMQRRIIVCFHGPSMRTKDGIDVLSFQHLAEQLAGNALWN
jgi:predicted AAA+ superfamily ATPase